MGLFNRPSRNPAPPKEPDKTPDDKPTAESALTKADVEAMIQGATQATAQQLTGVIGELRAGIEQLAGRPVVLQQPTQHQVIEPPVTDEDIDNAMSGNLCRCGTYPKIRAAIHKAAALKTAGI